jgi:hypothetical protein
MQKIQDFPLLLKLGCYKLSSLQDGRVKSLASYFVVEIE